MLVLSYCCETQFWPISLILYILLHTIAWQAMFYRLIASYVYMIDEDDHRISKVDDERERGPTK